MLIADSRGNKLVEIIDIDENAALAAYAPVTHCLAVVMVGDDYLLGWNNYRREWEIFGGCLETGETMRECILRECREEIGIADLEPDYMGLMHLDLVPDYFQARYRREYGGLFGIRLQPGDLQRIEKHRLDREEIGKVALLGELGPDEKIAEIDRELLNYYGGKAEDVDVPV